MTSFPVLFDDVFKCMHYLIEQWDTLKLTSPRILWGESSGASVAVSTAQHLVSLNQAFFDQQVFIYPMTDLINDTASRQNYGQGYFLDITMMNWLKERTLNHPSEAFDPRVSPLLATSNFKGQPDTLLITAEYDPLLDEGEAYGHLLMKHGVHVDVYREHSMTHGYFRYFDKTAGGQRTLAWLERTLKRLP